MTNNLKKLLIAASLLAVLILPNLVSATTVAEIQAQLSAILQQIQKLQQQLAQLQAIGSATTTPPIIITTPTIPTTPPTTGWCHTFNTNLGYGIGSLYAEVQALQTALEKEGFTISTIEKTGGDFGDSTASAVVGFQNKYKAEILTPLGLTNGTGYVGIATRTKLNFLYGCGGGGTPGGTTITYSNLIENAVPAEIYSIPNLPIQETNKRTDFTYDYTDVLYDNGNIYVLVTESKNYSAYSGGQWYNSTGVRVRFFKSTDGGKTWVEKTKVLDLEPQHVWNWAKIKKAGNAIYIIISGGMSGKGFIFSSSDEGTTWQAVNLPSDLYGYGGNNIRTTFDFLALDSNNFILVYNNQGTYDLTLAKSSDRGNTWSGQIIEKKVLSPDRTYYFTFGYPRLQLLGNGNVGLLYYRTHPITNSLYRSLLYRESSDKGTNWSSSQQVASSYVGRYNGGPDISPATYLTIVLNNHYLFTAGNKKIVGYTKEEFARPEPMNDVPAISEFNGSSWNNRYIKTVNGLNLTTNGNTGFSFAVSPNGKYMAFLGNGLMVPDGYYWGAADNLVVDRGVILMYSTDSGSSWKYKKIMSNYFSIETLGRFPDFFVNDNGEVLIAYPEITYSGGKKTYAAKFIGGRIDDLTTSATPTTPTTPTPPTPSPSPTPTSGGRCGDGICSNCMGFSPCLYDENFTTCPQDCKTTAPTGGVPFCSINFYPSTISSGQTAVASWISLNDADAKLDYVCKNSSGQIITGGDNQYVEALGTSKFKYEDISQYLPATCTLTAKNSVGQTAICSAHISKTSTACSSACLSDQSCVRGTCVYGVCGDKVCNDCSNAFSPCSINEPVTCPQDCGTTYGICGNGKLETGEECDDGNTTSGDGCSSQCKTELTPPMPTPTGINMTTTGCIPLYLNNQAVPALGTANYYAIMDSTYSKVTVNLESLDWDATDMDLVISNVRQPLCNEIVRGSWTAGTNDAWYASALARSNETVFIKQTIPAGTTIYATVCNFTASVTGKFRLSWSAY